ncbi:MAG TPA: MBL fold metallo-hydrolase [Patescibacteria group bacterium]|nr:MBL fold metallo-hydrolase [Patescibacteria group bacterium]
MKKYLVLGLIIILFFLSLSIYQLIVFSDGRLHITVCDVGQGDAVLIRTPGGHNILFDGGPDDRVLSCLSKYLPFWDRTFALILLSHPHADHLDGLIPVLSHYHVQQFATEDLANTSEDYKTLQEEVQKQHLAWQTLVDGDSITTDHGVSLTVVGPTQNFLDKTAINGKYITSSEFASLEVLIRYDKFTMLLTGDSQYQQMGEAVSSHPDLLGGITILQEPHHGSRTGITPEIIAALHPQVATISVGAHNPYGHPAPNTLSTLQNAHVQIHRTDREGDLRLTSDGKSYNLK